MRITLMIFALLITTLHNQSNGMFGRVRLASCAQAAILRTAYCVPRCQFTSMVRPTNMLAASSLISKVKIQTQQKRTESSCSGISQGEEWNMQTMLQSMPHNNKPESVTNIFTKQEVTEYLLNKHMQAMDNFIGSYFNFPQSVLAADYPRVVSRMVFWQNRKHQLFTAARMVTRTIEQEKELHKKYDLLENGYAQFKKYKPEAKWSEMECTAISELKYAERDQKEFLEGVLGVQK